MKRWRPDGGDEAKGYYRGYSEPFDQWEAGGRVTLDGAELELCQAVAPTKPSEYLSYK